MICDCNKSLHVIPNLFCHLLGAPLREGKMISTISRIIHSFVLTYVMDCIRRAKIKRFDNFVLLFSAIVFVAATMHGMTIK